MKLKFLSDDWFAAYDDLAKDVVMPAALSPVVANLDIVQQDGGRIKARIDGGFMRRGFAPGAMATITAPEAIIFTALVLGDVKAAMPAVFNGQLKIKGEKAPLIKVGMTPPSQSQKALSERLQQITVMSDETDQA